MGTMASEKIYASPRWQLDIAVEPRSAANSLGFFSRVCETSSMKLGTFDDFWGKGKGRDIRLAKMGVVLPEAVRWIGLTVDHNLVEGIGPNKFFEEFVEKSGKTLAGPTVLDNVQMDVSGANGQLIDIVHLSMSEKPVDFAVPHYDVEGDRWFVQGTHDGMIPLAADWDWEKQLGLRKTSYLFLGGENDIEGGGKIRAAFDGTESRGLRPFFTMAKLANFVTRRDVSYDGRRGKLCFDLYRKLSGRNLNGSKGVRDLVRVYSALLTPELMGVALEQHGDGNFDFPERREDGYVGDMLFKREALKRALSDA